jgi:hypothetical protein
MVRTGGRGESRPVLVPPLALLPECTTPDHPSLGSGRAAGGGPEMAGSVPGGPEGREPRPSDAGQPHSLYPQTWHFTHPSS